MAQPELEDLDTIVNNRCSVSARALRAKKVNGL